MSQPPPQAPPSAGKRRFNYPPSPTGSVVDELHGVSVPDPYRWLEDSNSAETQAWIAAQNQLTRGFLDGLPERETIRKRLRELWDFERFEAPFERSGRYFYFYNSGLQNQPALYWLKTLDAQPVLLLDPNLLASDGTVALTHVEPTDDGKLVAYGLSRAGSDWT
jgi:prolyl oligopeptidase